MTVCNMSIEAGARAGLVAPDETTFAYLQGRHSAPTGDGLGRGRRPTGERLVTDDDAVYDKEVVIDADHPVAARHLGHEPGPGHPLTPRCPRRRLRRRLRA